ncbi:YkgJ family cysteine cluster protein [Pseudomonas pudica]|uniref:YkgJ family cysteine cluster protein n=1 Tax=Pseudomonas pudica TaxID=272772 RepID=UPI003207C41A
MQLSNCLGKRAMKSPVHFDCIAGCGACCKGRFVPLTLAETESWLARGDDVVVLLEAFSTLGANEQSPAYRHNHARSAAARSGSADIQVIAVFAAANLQGCPNQLADTRCGIYTERPLVCRIYPMEVNPFIVLNPATKECPTTAWSQMDGEPLIASDGLPPPALRQLIDASRQADREDALVKVNICRHLGFTTTAWKGNGFTVFFPTNEQLRLAIAHQSRSQAPATQWHVRIHGEALRLELEQLGVQLASEAPDQVFIPLAS